MDWRRSCLTLCIFLSLCSASRAQTAETTLYGQWKLDREATIADLTTRAADAEVKPLLEELASPDCTVRLQFQTNGVAIVSEGSDLPETMSWRTLKERSPLEIAAEIFPVAGGVEADRMEFVASFVAKDVMRLKIKGMPVPLLFNRMEPPGP